MLLYFSFVFHKEIPRVITAIQQQNTAPEVQQYDADPYQTDEDGGGNGRGEIKHLIGIMYKV